MSEAENETAFAELMRPYEDQWIALEEEEGVKIVVGVGRNAVEAIRDAESKGHHDAALFKVPSFRTGFIPLVSTLATSH